MANQAIALQARAPQNDFMGRAIQQNAQMMNMMAQQRTAERQAAVAQQEMEIARAAEARAVAKEGRDTERFAVDQDALLYAKYRNMAPSVIESNDPEVYAQWLGMLNEENPQRAQIIARAMPPERFDKERFRRMMATMDQSFEARYGKAITKELITPEGDVLGANISGLPGATYATPIPDISRPRAGAPAQTPMSAPGAGVDATATRGTATGPADLRAQGVDPRSIPSGNPLQPISMTTGAQMGGQPDMTAVVQDMMSSGQISQSNLQLMREMAGPDKDAQLAQILKANNIQIVPDDQPGMRSAVFRPGQDVAPQMQQVQFNPNDYEPVRVKSPMQSPAPGTVLVPTPVIREQEGAKTAGSEGVRVGTQPKIVAGEERARRLEKLRGDIPVAKNTTQSLITDIDDRIASIDRLLRHPYRYSIIGPIEGRIPGIFQTPTRADVQALFDKIKNTATLTELTKLKTSTETGGSPLGSNPTDRDARIVETAASALIQTGNEGEFDAELIRLRNKLYRLRTTAVDSYNDAFREVLPEEPRMKLRVPSISPKYERTSDLKAKAKGGGSGWGKAKVVGD